MGGGRRGGSNPTIRGKEIIHKKQRGQGIATDTAGHEPGTPLVYEYTYHEMKIIVDGSFDISDETGKKVHATKGDVFYFPKGSKITFETDDFGLGFFCGQRKKDGA